MDVTGVISSADELLVELLLEPELFRFNSAAGDLFHRLREEERSFEVAECCACASQLAIKEASTPSRIRL
jgi:hypothetical protein